MEAAANPYQTPEGELQQTDDTPAEVKIFSPSGRIGRLRYLAYGTAMGLISYAIMGVLFAMVLATGGLNGEPSGGVLMFAGLLYAVVGIVGMVIGIFWIIKRLHDMDKTGWLALLMIVPLVNFILILFLLFTPGSANSNRFGAPPVPNTTGVKILASLFPVMIVFVMGLNAYLESMAGIQ